MAPSMKRINPTTLAQPTGYSHVVEVAGGRTIYVSGQIARDRSGVLVGAGDLKAQTVQVFENLKLALAASGATFANLVKITVFMIDVSQIQIFRDVRDRYLTDGVPTSSLVQVVGLASPELLIEIEAIAVIE